MSEPMAQSGIAQHTVLPAIFGHVVDSLSMNDNFIFLICQYGNTPLPEQPVKKGRDEMKPGTKDRGKIILFASRWSNQRPAAYLNIKKKEFQTENIKKQPKKAT
jgi:hypothetical protein